MLIILAAEPAVGWILLPSVLLGGVVAFTLHYSKSHDWKTGELKKAEIQIARIPVTGVIGFIFTIGMMAVFFTALPEVRFFLLLALPLGVVLGIALYYFHT